MAPTAATAIKAAIKPYSMAVAPALSRTRTNDRPAPSDFIIRSDGVCRLSPQLARAVVPLIK